MKSSILHCLYLYHLVLFIQTTGSLRVKKDEPCIFPPSFRGTWLNMKQPQRTLTITSSSVIGMGRCVAKRGTKFLIERGSKCFKCLFIADRHRNIMQYREAVCISHNSMDDACDKLDVNRQLRMLIREEPLPSICPFPSAYQLKYYLPGWGGTNLKCSNYRSTLNSCAGNGRMRLRLTDTCDVTKDVSFMPDSELQCIGRWKNRHDYVMVKLLGETDAPLSQQYRCLLFQEQTDYEGNIMTKVAWSEDGLCDIRRFESLNVDLIMTLKPASMLPAYTCEYPSWLQGGRAWTELGANDQYTLSDNSLLETSSLASSGVVKATMQCVEKTSQSVTRAEIAAHIYDGCNTGYQCLRFKKKSEHVVLLQKGPIRMKRRDACSARNFYNSSSSTSHLLFDSSHDFRFACPELGSFTGEINSTNTAAGSTCRRNLDVGCQSPLRITLTDNCSTDPLSYRCVYSWREFSNSYIIVQNINNNISSCISVPNLEADYSILRSNRQVRTTLPIDDVCPRQDAGLTRETCADKKRREMQQSSSASTKESENSDNYAPETNGKQSSSDKQTKHRQTKNQSSSQSSGSSSRTFVHSRALTLSLLAVLISAILPNVRHRACMRHGEQSR